MKATILPFTLITLALAPLARPEVPEGLGASDWQSIRATHEARRHAFAPTETGWRARNPGQRWTTEFDGRGFLATPDEGDWIWGLELLGYGVGEFRIPIAGRPSVATEGRRLAYRWDEHVEEWWINDRRGLEHGYIVAKRPSADGAGDAPLTFHLATRGGLLPRVSPGARDLVFEDAAGRAVLNYTGLKAWDAEGRALTARFESGEGSALRLVVEDRAAVYPVTIDPIAQQACLKAGNTDAADQFGFSVAVSGDTMVVGAQGEDSDQAGVTNGPGGSADNSASFAGAAYVFVRDGSGNWSQQAYLKAGNTDDGDPDPDRIDRFGFSVSISGDTIVVGAPEEDSNQIGVTNGPGGSADNSSSSSGAAYVFVRDGSGNWSQQAYLKAGNPDDSDRFGESVSVSGDTVVVGAKNEDSNQRSVTNGSGGSADDSADAAGAAYVFVRDGSGNWTQQAYLKAGNADANDYFGLSVSVSGDTAVVGAHGEDSTATTVTNGPGGSSDNSAPSAGAAYVFVRDGSGNWSQQAYLKPGTIDDWDEFGYSVSVSDDTVVVGALYEDSNATGVVNGSAGSADNSVPDSGAAFVFVRDELGAWTQQAYLKAGNTGTEDEFGYSVSVSDDAIVIGAHYEDSNARSSTEGPGGSADNSATDAGAAYLFVRNGATWSQRAYLKGANSDAGDEFGYSVSVSGDTMVAGAPYEDSNATGVTNGAGGSSDNSAPNAGAAYVFLVSESPPASPRLTVTRPGAFPPTLVGRRSNPQTIRVRNIGGSAATGLSARLSGNAATDFLITRPSPTLAPGAATSFRVTFRPKAKGLRRATVTVRSANAVAQSVPLTGRGR